MHFSCLEAAIQRAGNVSGHQAAVTGHRVFCACVAELFPGSDATRGHHALRVSVQRVEISKPRLDFSQSCARIARCRRHQISRDAIVASAGREDPRLLWPRSSRSDHVRVQRLFDGHCIRECGCRDALLSRVHR